MPSLLLSVFLAISLMFAVFAFAEDEVPVQEIQVNARSLQEKDEVSYTPHSVVLEHPSSDVSLGETLTKLPGSLVRNTSGFGSATTLITSQALSSAGTAVSVDDIPILEPTGTGVNFSLFPTTLIGSVEHHSPFYPILDPTTESLPNPGGRINLKTLGAPRAGEHRLLGSMLFGTGNTIQGTAGYRFGNANSNGVLGVTGFNTKGDYHYKDPTTGASANRGNNGATGGGALAKYERKLGKTGSFEILDLFSRSERTNPGPLDFPSRDHEADTFNLLGARYSDSELFSKNDGFFSKLAGTYTRIAVDGTRFASDSKVLSSYVQAGVVHRASWWQDIKNSITFSLDNQHNQLRDDTSLFHRNVLGFASTLNVDWMSPKAGRFQLIPLVRQEVPSSAYPNATDGMVSVVYSPSVEHDLSLSYGLQHVYPSITAVSGFRTNGFTLLPNPTLAVQRDSIASVAYTMKLTSFTLYSTAFFDRIRNRATPVNFTTSTGQIVNANDVQAWGYTIDAQLFLHERLTLRNSLTVQRAWDKNTNKEMPYKPRLEDWATVSFGVMPSFLWIALQERFTGKRFTTASNDAVISPLAQTDFRIDVSAWGGTAFFKIANLLDTGAFEFPGFPIPGRSYWLGFTL